MSLQELQLTLRERQASEGPNQEADHLEGDLLARCRDRILKIEEQDVGSRLRRLEHEGPVIAREDVLDGPGLVFPRQAQDRLVSGRGRIDPLHGVPPLQHLGLRLRRLPPKGCDDLAPGLALPFRRTSGGIVSMHSHIVASHDPYSQIDITMSNPPVRSLLVSNPPPEVRSRASRTARIRTCTIQPIRQTPTALRVPV